MASNQQFCLRWNNHQSTLISVFDTLLESGTLVDCTLAAEGQSLKAHKVVLSACSPYLESLLSQHYEKHPILILKDVTFTELKAMLDYMYRGEVNICQDQLATFLKAAESLQIKGLTDNTAFEAPRKERKMNFISQSPLFPQGLIVQHRPKMNSSPNNNNNEVKSDGGTSPRRRKRRRSAEDNGSDGGELPGELPGDVAPECLVKTECKTEREDGNESGEEVPCDADDEEELDLSRPGTSQAQHNSIQPGWNAGGESPADEMFPPGQGDQEAKVLTRPLVPSLKAMDTYMRQFNTTLSLTGTHHLYQQMAAAAAAAAGTPNQQPTQPPRNAIECPDCGKTYSSQHTLRRHMRLECGKEPQFHCPYCPRKTKQRYNLMLHIARAHKPPVDQQPPYFQPSPPNVQQK